jgi:DNA-directed RNA polymerase sigma subunit (sigma70/sigma32)
VESEGPVTVYVRMVHSVPELTKSEESELSEHVLAHDEQAESAGKRLIEANLAAVVSIAEGYAQVHSDAGVYLLDLIQKGNDGLALALETFADGSGKSFSAHAAACAKEAIEKAANTQ